MLRILSVGASPPETIAFWLCIFVAMAAWGWEIASFVGMILGLYGVAEVAERRDR